MNYYVMIMFLFFGAYCNAFDAYDLHKAASAYRSGDFATAQSLYEKVYVHSQNNPEVMYNYAKSSYALSEFEKAEALFQNVLDSQSISDQLQKQAHFDLGNSLVRQKKYEDALSHYEAVNALDPDHKESQEMVEQIKKILEQQKQQNQNQQQQSSDNQQQQDQNDNQQQKSDDKSRNDKSRNNESQSNDSDKKNESGEQNQQQKSSKK